MQPVRHWRIHIGAHKTATTHLQDCLALQRGDLAKLGVDYVPRERLREVGFGRLFRNSGWRRILPDPINKRAFDEAMRALRVGPQTVAISDETIAGGIATLFERTLYPDIENRLRALNRALGTAEIDLFLSVRSFETLLSSAYVQALRSRPVVGGISALRAKWMMRPPSWAELAERIRSAMPHARLHVWTFEDYAARPHCIQQSFVGTKAVRAVDLIPPKVTRTPSAEAIRQLEQIGFRLTRGSYRAVAARICEQDQGQSTYAPLGDDEGERLAEAYRHDLSLLEKQGIPVLGRCQE